MIFVDTSFWIALRVRRDAHHTAAAELARRHGDDNWLTSGHVRGEAWTLISRKEGHARAGAFLDQLARSARVDIVHVSEEMEIAALRSLRRRGERDYSFVDATSFVLMRELGIRRALTFDEDFDAAGFTMLRVEG